MAKFSGKIGYVSPEVEDPNAPGNWLSPTIIELNARGELLRASKDYQSSEEVADNISITNRISIVADKDMLSFFQNLRYVVMYGTRWKIESVEIDRPRLVLTLGGVWNGQVPKSTP